uniref:Uncharacterized protein n=1 Tax=viral metagenome TaxID=1070528 RepID=A0A6M3J5C5_9ZZZZ
MARVRMSLNVIGKHGSLKLAGTDLQELRVLMNYIVEKSPYIPMNQIGEHVGVKMAGTRLDYVCFNIEQMEAR